MLCVWLKDMQGHEFILELCPVITVTLLYGSTAGTKGRALTHRGDQARPACGAMECPLAGGGAQGILLPAENQGEKDISLVELAAKAKPRCFG